MIKRCLKINTQHFSPQFFSYNTKLRMQFTPQQIAGGPRFSPKTKIGNWLEEIALEESKLNDFKKRSTAGSSLLANQVAKLSTCNQLVSQSVSTDGTIRFGFFVILQHESSGSLLACDPSEESVRSRGFYRITGLLDDPVPRARNVFQIIRPPHNLKNRGDDDESDPILRIGQPFCLICHEVLLVDRGSSVRKPALFLNSTAKSEWSSTPSSNKQVVYLSTSNGPESVWIITRPSRGRKNPSERILSLGNPVTTNEQIIIMHRQTSMFLRMDAERKFISEFGTEVECYADRTSANGKMALLLSEFEGLSIPQALSKPDLPVFYWKCVISPPGSENVDSAGILSRIASVASVDNLVNDMRDSIVAKGLSGFWDLRTSFIDLMSKIPAVRDGKMEREDLKEVVTQWGCPFDPYYLDSLFNLLDPQKVGVVDWRDFLTLVRGPLAYERQDALIELFSRMDKKGDGAMTAGELGRVFNAAAHPMVTEHQLEAADAFEHFLKCTVESSFGLSRVRGPGTVITFESFCNYYADLSATLHDDEEFRSYLNNGWTV